MQVAQMCDETFRQKEQEKDYVLNEVLNFETKTEGGLLGSS